MGDRGIKQTVQSLLDRADVKINGNRPWDIKVNHPQFYSRVMAGGSLALGESYMDGWWNCQALDEFFHRILKSKLHQKIKPISLIYTNLKARLINLQSKTRSKKVAKKHYDLSPALYKSFLDPYNQYTCGYFKNTNDLNKAQEQKLDLICKKLKLSSKDKVLDIGCGWGGFAKFAAERYGCQVTGISISERQVKYARNFCQGLPVTIIKSDYRDFKGTFDKVLVCGMIEHVGYKNYQTLMKTVHRRLKKGGLFLLHTIGGNRSTKSVEHWLEKYIFPNSMLPSAKQITGAAESLFRLEDWHSFGSYYDKTLMAWHQNFTKNWNKIKDYYDQRFYRMWNYYLLCCAGAFRAEMNQLWQVVFSKGGVKEGYRSIR
ncbi:cyclopropane fatty acyl phospholipid synthase [Nanoarchaeota archaeon]